MEKAADKLEFPNDFVFEFSRVQEVVHSTAVGKGWWYESVNPGEKIALMHSELSEALEALRNGDPPDDKITEFSGSEAELADVIIRIMDFAAHYKLRVAEALLAKAAYNETRPFKHGGKRF